jgi:diacylglycerol O-acyltransferase / wax synthase
MNPPHWERLTPLDASFIGAESSRAPMHVASVSLLDARPVTTPAGGLDFARLERAIQRMVQRTPRLRQKLWWPPGCPPVWIDDSDFRFSYHVRQSALPLPGTVRQLKRTAGRILSQRLDVAKPLWEIWLIEGVEGERFAMIAKLHHALADGISARDILLEYMSSEPGDPPAVNDTWRPRPAPSAVQLHLDEVRRRLDRSRTALDTAVRWLWSAPLRASSRTPAALRAGGEQWLDAVRTWTRKASATPLNQEIGPHRRIDWTSCDLVEVKRIAKCAGGKVNDVALAIVAGAVRRFLLARGVPLAGLDFRVMVPVSVRTSADGATAGNRVSNMLVSLPIGEAEPRCRLLRVIEATVQAKLSKQSESAELLIHFADWAGLFIPSAVARGAAQRVANAVVTNVPGPTAPIYMAESRLLETYPAVPLAERQALGIALQSYNGRLYWGLLADRDALPDLHTFATAIDLEFEELAKLPAQ